jgi:hypothetical protein
MSHIAIAFRYHYANSTNKIAFCILIDAASCNNDLPLKATVKATVDLVSITENDKTQYVLSSVILRYLLDLFVQHGVL